MTPLEAAFLIALESADKNGDYSHRDGRIYIECFVQTGQLDEAIRSAVDQVVLS